MPYSVPDGFFDKLEADIREELRLKSEEGLARQPDGEIQSHASRSTFHFPKIAIFAVAASLVLFFVVKATPPKNEADGFEAVELAFNNLSQDDQEYLLLVYEQEDLFITEIEAQ